MSYRRRKSTWISLVLAILIIAATQSGWLKDTAKNAQQNDPGLYTINHYVDGDTIAVNMNGSVETIRFIGVDTPETHKPNTPVQCYGPEAAAHTKAAISKFGKVRLQADPLDTNRDRYGRRDRNCHMYMIRDATDRVNTEAVVLGDLAQLAMHERLQHWGNQRFSTSCCPNKVIEQPPSRHALLLPMLALISMNTR